ncbi:hypothetical protein EZS27_019652 [termite gut metagenome]|uniref:Uncharacterized protein n=1 Tax=termite gut metagenome TaxID=433724 RepID=A0A5J4RFV3_9ZZZZ
MNSETKPRVEIIPHFYIPTSEGKDKELLHLYENKSGEKKGKKTFILDFSGQEIEFTLSELKSARALIDKMIEVVSSTTQDTKTISPKTTLSTETPITFEEN